MEQVIRNITRCGGAALYQTAGAVWKFADTRLQQSQSWSNCIAVLAHDRNRFAVAINHATGDGDAIPLQ